MTRTQSNVTRSALTGVAALFCVVILTGCSLTLPINPPKVKSPVKAGSLIWRINKLERSRLFRSKDGALAVTTLDNVMIRLEVHLRNAGSEPFVYGEICSLEDALGEVYPEHIKTVEAIDKMLLPRTGELAPGKQIQFSTVFEVPKDAKRLAFKAFGETFEVDAVMIPLRLKFK
jgi:hypothetical protein